MLKERECPLERFLEHEGGGGGNVMVYHIIVTWRDLKENVEVVLFLVVFGRGGEAVSMEYS